MEKTQTYAWRGKELSYWHLKASVRAAQLQGPHWKDRTLMRRRRHSFRTGKGEDGRGYAKSLDAKAVALACHERAMSLT